MKRIEFGELVIGEVARKNLMHVCDTNWASGGPKVKQLEKEQQRFRKYFLIHFYFWKINQLAVQKRLQELM